MVNLAPGFKVAKVSDLTTKFETIFKLLTYFLSCSIKSYFVYFIDHASARYIFTKMSPLTQLIFNPKDEPILKYIQEDNQWVEPNWYVPILPMVLVNGADGIGTGWMTKIPNYNPRDLVEIINDLLDGKRIEETKRLIPWYNGFKGTIEPLDYQRYVCNGEIAEISDTKVVISELPIKTWTNSYKESVLEIMQNGNDEKKIKAVITDYKDNGTDSTINYTVSMPQEEKRKAELEKGGLHTFFKLQNTIATTSMVLFDKNKVIKKYDNVREILQEFYEVRLEYYGKRKKHLEKHLGAEALLLSNKARFIVEKCKGDITVENKKRKKIIAELIARNYDPDPVKKWEKEHSQQLDQESQVN